jgi:hypothetical protein
MDLCVSSRLAATIARHCETKIERDGYILVVMRMIVHPRLAVSDIFSFEMKKSKKGT